MGIMDRLIGKARQPKPEDVIVGFRRGLPVPPGRFDDRHIAERYTSWGYIAANRNATAIAALGCQVMTNDRTSERKPTKQADPCYWKHLRKAYTDQTTDDTIAVPDHPFVSVLRKPNPILEKSGLLELTTLFLQLKGNAYWYVVLNRLGQPYQLWPLPAHRMWPVLGGDNIFDRYELRYASETIKFDPDEIVHFRLPSPIEPIEGYSPTDGVRSAIETNQRYLEYEHALLENMGVPDILITPKPTSAKQGGGTLGDTSFKRLIEDWAERFGGWRKRGKVAGYKHPLEVQTLGQTNRDMRLDQNKPQIAEQILAGYGVPEAIVKADGTTFNNMRTGLQIWATFTLQPIAARIADTVNCSLMHRYGVVSDGNPATPVDKPTYWLAFDSPVPDDDLGAAQVHEIYARNGILVPDEIRAELGRDERPDGLGGLPVHGAGSTSDVVIDENLIERIDLDEELGEGGGQGGTGGEGTVDATETPAEAPEPIPFQQVVQALSVAHTSQDIDLANMLRTEIALRLGQTPLPDKEEPDDLENQETGAPGSQAGASSGQTGEDTGKPGKAAEGGDCAGTHARSPRPDKDAAGSPTKDGGSDEASSVEVCGKCRKMTVFTDSCGRHFCEVCQVWTKDAGNDEASSVAASEGPPPKRKPKPKPKADETCVERWIRELTAAHPDWAHDQVVAVAHAKCDESKDGKHVARSGLEAAVISVNLPSLPPAIIGKLALGDIDIEKDREDGPFIRELKALWREWKAEVLLGLAAVMTSSQVTQDAAGMATAASLVVNRKKWLRKLVIVGRSPIKDAIQRGAALGLDDLLGVGVQAATEISVTLPGRMMKPILDKTLSKFASKVVAVVEDDLKTAMMASMDASETPIQLSKRIAGIYDEKRDHSSDRIARTELSNALNEGAQQQWKRGGATYNEWLASVDACQFCIKLNGRRRKIGEPFVKQGDAVIGVDGGRMVANYKTITRPTLHPHCTCTLVPVVEDSE